MVFDIGVSDRFHNRFFSSEVATDTFNQLVDQKFLFFRRTVDVHDVVGQRNKLFMIFVELGNSRLKRFVPNKDVVV